MAIHVGFIRMSGRYLHAIDAIPVAVLRHIGQQLNLAVPDIATLRTLYRRHRTMETHQNIAARLLGFQPFTPHRRRALVRALRSLAYETPTETKLLDVAKRWLYDRRILLPATRSLLAIARTAHRQADRHMLDDVHREIGTETITQWEAALFAARGGALILEWLQQPPTAGFQGLRESLTRIDYLKSLDVDRCSLTAVRFERQCHFARRIRRRRPARFRTLHTERRVLEMACFLRVNLLQTTDTALDLVDHLIQQLHARTTARIQREHERSATEFREILCAIRAVVQDTTIPDTESLEQIAALIPQERLLLPSRAAAVRWSLAQQTTSVRRLLRLLLSLDFQAAADSPLPAAVAMMRQCHEQSLTRLPDEADSSFAPRWSDIIDGPDRKWALRGFEAALLVAIRQSLRNGALWVPHSLKYRRRDEILLPPRVWQSRRQPFLDRVGVPTSPSSYVNKLTAHIGAALEAVDEAVSAGEVTVDDRGLHLPTLTAEDRSDAVERTARELFASIGPVQLPDIIASIDSETRFSWSLLGREPTDEREVLSMYAGLLAHGTELDALGVSLMIPTLSEERVGNAMRLLEEAPYLREANKRVLQFQRRPTVVKHWGSGLFASADAMTLDASRRLWNARVDPKRRRYGVAVYTHLLDQWGIFYDQPIVVTQREAGAAFEGAVRQEEGLRLERLAVDTHGYTDFGMAMARILGFDLCPRLKSLRDRKLHVPRGLAVPESLTRVVERDISLPQLEQGWDEFLRVCASVDSGWTSAVLALERFGSASRADPAYKSGRALGQLLRTLYLCDYFTNPDFRREVLRILSHGESVHGLQRAIYFGGIAAARGRRRDELIAISGSLTLLCNVVIAWMTHEIQRVLDRWTQQGRKVNGDVLRHIAPARFHGVNMRGTMAFPIARYRERLIPGAQGC